MMKEFKMPGVDVDALMTSQRKNLEAIGGAIDGSDGAGWAVSPQFNKPHTAQLGLAQAVGFEGGTILRLELSQQFNDGMHSLGHFRVSVTTSPQPTRARSVPAPVAAALAVAVATVRCAATPAAAGSLAAIATAVVSDPPLPSVVISFSRLTP